MRAVRTAAMLMLAATIMFSSACKKKKPKLPPASTAPTVAVPLPEPTLPPSPEITPSPAPAPSTSTETTTPEPKPKPKHRSTHKPKPATPAPPPVTTTQPTKSNPASTGVSSSSGETMTISPDLPKNEADSQKRATEQMLQNAEANLRAVNRQLSDSEQGMVRQIRNYITQSRLATQDGDLERARNLAVKAQLLSGELNK